MSEALFGAFIIFLFFGLPLLIPAIGNGVKAILDHRERMAQIKNNQKKQ